MIIVKRSVLNTILNIEWGLVNRVKTRLNLHESPS